MIKHTQGPWHATFTTINNEYWIKAPDGKLIVSISSKEDATLIAAAPELLQALNQLVEYIVTRHPMDARSAVAFVAPVLRKVEGK